MKSSGALAATLITLALGVGLSAGCRATGAASGAGASGATVSGAASSQDEFTVFADQLFEAANQARAQAGLEPLAASACAQPFAQQRAAALIGSPTLIHAPLFDLNQACALPGRVSGENLLVGVGTPQQMVEAWLASPTHRANLLNANYTDAALACVNDPDPQGNPRMLCSHLFLG